MRVDFQGGSIILRVLRVYGGGMQRDCYHKLVEWNNEGDRKPLVVIGAGW